MVLKYLKIPGTQTPLLEAPQITPAGREELIKFREVILLCSVYNFTHFHPHPLRHYFTYFNSRILAGILKYNLQCRLYGHHCVRLSDDEIVMYALNN